MIPYSKFIKVPWAALKTGDVVTLIAYHKNKEYTCGEYRVVCPKVRLLKVPGHRSFSLTEDNTDKDFLLVKRIINPHLKFRDEAD